MLWNLTNTGLFSLLFQLHFSFLDDKMLTQTFSRHSTHTSRGCLCYRNSGGKMRISSQKFARIFHHPDWSVWEPEQSLCSTLYRTGRTAKTFGNDIDEWNKMWMGVIYNLFKNTQMWKFPPHILVSAVSRITLGLHKTQW